MSLYFDEKRLVHSSFHVRLNIYGMSHKSLNVFKVSYLSYRSSKRVGSFVNDRSTFMLYVSYAMLKRRSTTISSLNEQGHTLTENDHY